MPSKFGQIYVQTILGTRVCSDIVRLPNQPTLWFIVWSQMERLKQWFLDFINWMIWHYIPPRQYPESQVQTFENAPIYCHWSDGSAIRLACPINIKISHFYNVMQEWLDQMPRSAYSHEFVSLCPPSPNVTFYNVTFYNVKILYSKSVPNKPINFVKHWNLR